MDGEKVPGQTEKGLALIGKGLRSGNPPTPRAKNKSAAEKLHFCLQLL